jgi:hypothetical protein
MSPDGAGSNPHQAWLDLLSDEYRVLQDKIDKIGAFRFTIRGWSITLVLASAFGAIAAKLPSYYPLLGLVVIVASFFFMERDQVRYRLTFGRRAAILEKRIWRLLRSTTPARAAYASGGMVPGLAHEISDMKLARSSLTRWLDMHGYWFFYGFQIVLIVFLSLWLDHERGTARQPETPSITIVNSGPDPSRQDRPPNQPQLSRQERNGASQRANPRKR